MPNAVVLGTGMAGFGAAHHLRAEGITPMWTDESFKSGEKAAGAALPRLAASPARRQVQVA